MSVLRPHFVIFLLLVGVSLRAEAGLPFMSETVSWDEDVLLADGQLLSVHRTATYGADAYGRSGRGSLKKQTIRFSRNGQKIKWENNDRWPINYMPEILDFVDAIPVIILPVHRWGPCEKYGFPQEGLAAFGYRNGLWGRIAFSDVPKELKVNLLRGTHKIRYWTEYKGKRITPAIKQDLERTNWVVTKQGQSIAEVSKFYASDDEPCAYIRPLPNPSLEASKQQNAEAETHAQALIATVISSSNSPEKISADDYGKAKAETVRESCKGVVDYIESMRQYRDGGSWHLVGYTLVLRDKSRVPIQQPNIKWAQATDLLESVTCDKSSIYSVKRHSRDQLIIHRFSHSGTLIDALHITLPHVAQFFPGEKWPMIWEVLPENGNLGVTLASYSYTGTANQGGLVEQRVNYTIQLPK
jgi:hypothetical protein